MPFVRTRGATIYYEMRGTLGPPLVLIRGFASSIRTWNGVDEDLASDHLVVVIDNRGIGRSSAPCGTYNVPRMADDVVAVMADAGLDAAHVLGTSLGGMIAQELVLRYPARVQSLVLAATTSGTPGTPALRTRGLLAVAAACFMPPRLRARLAAMATLSAETRLTRPAVIERRSDQLRRYPTPFSGLFGQASAIFGHRAADRLGTIRVPTLVIHGQDDNLVDFAHARLLHSLIPTAQLDPWPGAGHDLATEAPERLARCVREHVHAARRSLNSRRPPLATSDDAPRAAQAVPNAS